METKTNVTDHTIQSSKGLEIPKLPPTPPESTIDDNGVGSSSAFEPEFPLPPPTSPPKEVLEIDKSTPDAHVPRDPRLIRLTGVHPFNVEAPLTDLFNEGFLTSPNLFYVRNHGPVPKVEDYEILDWTFTVSGLVENPITVSVKDLIETYQNITYPVTFVCAGNRRKEQNVVRKSKGFSWGPAGLSTAIWTGVAMSDVIRKAKPLRRGRFVCMEGADKLPNGYYGTSVKLNWVMDPNKGIMLSYKMNGEFLAPDHGKPLRAVIPGQIGGRSVKWLKKLIITDAPSDNWYHIYDNRLLPTMVTPQMSDENKDWWKDDRYAIYDLNVNSAIAYPAHDERLALNEAPKQYNARGYAYAGGGRRVTRVELSLDRGKSWRLANIDYPEDRYRQTREQNLYGGALDMSWRETSFCWCFWDLEIPIVELEQAQDLFVRCMDESLALQPRDMYWSVLGMMNNPWFRVVIHHEGGELRFEHPTLPALMPGGWMERVKKAGGNLLNGYWGESLGNEETQVETKPTEIKMTKDGVKRVIDVDELRKHDSTESSWFVVNGEVYDGTPFLKDHPGGTQSIISAAGMDATDEFMAIHSENAKAMMPDYHIGSLDEASRKFLAEGPVPIISNGPRPIFLDSRTWMKAVLHSKRSVSWDSRIFTFKLEHDEQEFGLPTGQHVMMRLKDPETKENIIRSYTPLSETSAKGHLDILVKIYFDTADRRGGKMTKAMDTLPIGQHIEFKGPIGKFQYLGRGRCSVNGIERNVNSFYMICGGSGITPIYQVFRAVMQDKEDTTNCIILDGNRLEEDILCKKELDYFAQSNQHKCKVLHTLTKASNNWNGLRGRIGPELLREHFPWKNGAMVLICGPETLEKASHKTLSEQGWDDSDLLFF